MPAGDHKTALETSKKPKVFVFWLLLGKLSQSLFLANILWGQFCTLLLVLSIWEISIPIPFPIPFPCPRL